MISGTLPKKGYFWQRPEKSHAGNEKRGIGEIKMVSSEEIHVAKPRQSGIYGNKCPSVFWYTNYMEKYIVYWVKILHLKLPHCNDWKRLAPSVQNYTEFFSSLCHPVNTFWKYCPLHVQHVT